MVKVLVVDDSEPIREQVKEVLSRFNMFVVEASHGYEAIKILNGDSHFDLIISDLRMPFMDGVDFLDKMNSMAKCQNTAKILLTSSPSKKVLDKERIHRFDCLVIKPIHEESFVRVIKKTMQLHERVNNSPNLLQASLDEALYQKIETLAEEHQLDVAAMVEKLIHLGIEQMAEKS